MKRVDIKIGFRCNNMCAFCVQGDKRTRASDKKKHEVFSDLKESFEKGCRAVVFTGGEPTMHPNFLKLIKIAKKMKYETIQIQTNGRMFSDINFCFKAIKAGANQFAPALHGHTSEIHDFLTGAKNSFAQTMEGIKNLKKLRQHVLTNTVITSKNYKFLPQIAELLVKLKVDQFQFAFVHILGSADKNKKWLIPKKSKVAPYLKKALDVGTRAGKRVTAEAVPYCFMQGNEDCIAENIALNMRIYDGKDIVEDFEYVRKNNGKSKGFNCKKCKYDEICEGPWKEYPEIFGWDEFVPILK